MTTRPPWKPSPREQHLLWYIQAINRYAIGGGGLVWAMLTDHLNPVLLLVLGTIATATDVFGFIQTLIQTAKEEKQEIDRLIEEEFKH